MDKKLKEIPKTDDMYDPDFACSFVSIAFFYLMFVFLCVL